MSAPDRLPVGGTFNLRDVGGIPAEGGVVRRGRLLRSDALHRVDDPGREQLSRLRVTRVVDLRDDDEVSAAPNALTGVAAEVLRRPIFGGWAASAGSAPMASFVLADLYAAMVSQRGEALAGAVAAIAEAEDGAVLVHCTAGKDRTGVVVALALSAVGVPRDAVLDDYVRTEANLAGEWLSGMLETMRSLPIPDGVDLAALLGASPREVLAGTLDSVEQRYGSAADYLRAHGLSDEQLARLRARLVELD
ncbi:tyrosine-protein phosphatase [Microbacteriaceae bacterium VKM Ac-2854]|nr:tyrosine-protein phosphatase [Microbacteriaceae bacterium VKM Ac-2854]